jgi:hypothetical protein
VRSALSIRNAPRSCSTVARNASSSRAFCVPRFLISSGAFLRRLRSQMLSDSRSPSSALGSDTDSASPPPRCLKPLQ